MAKKATSKSTVPAKQSGNNTPALPPEIDITADIGGGLEGADKDSYAIPFLRVIQKMSPQVDEASPEYNEDARPGMLLNTVTGELIDAKSEDVHFLPCAFQRRFLLWGPRDNGGGYEGEYLPEQAAQLRHDGKAVEIDGRLYAAGEDGKASEKTSSRFTDTRSHFGILLVGETATPVLLSLSSTQIKKSKQLMSILSQARVDTAKGPAVPPTWLNKIKLGTVVESNDNGSWHGIRFEADGFITDPALYNMAKGFHDQVANEQARADYAAAHEESSTSDKF